MERDRCFERIKPSYVPKKVDMTGYKPFDYDEYLSRYLPSIRAETARQNVPTVYEQGFRTVDDINQPEAVEIARVWCETWTPEQRRGLMFIGDTGVGKTALAWSVIIAMREYDKTTAVFSFTELMRKIRRSYSKDAKASESEDALIEGLLEADIIMLDDLGTERPTEATMQTLHDVLDEIYKAGKHLIVTSNYDGEALWNHWGGSAEASRVMSRLSEMVTPVRMTGPDLRIPK